MNTSICECQLRFRRYCILLQAGKIQNNRCAYKTCAAAAVLLCTDGTKGLYSSWYRICVVMCVTCAFNHFNELSFGSNITYRSTMFLTRRHSINAENVYIRTTTERKRRRDKRKTVIQDNK